MRPSGTPVRAASASADKPEAQRLFEHVAQLVLKQRQCGENSRLAGTLRPVAPDAKFILAFVAQPAASPHMDSPAEILDIFTRTRGAAQRALLLRSGHYCQSSHRFNAPGYCQRMDAVSAWPSCSSKVRALGLRFDTDARPDGGLVIGRRSPGGQGPATSSPPKTTRSMLRRGFTLAPGEPVLVVEDVVTWGGRVVKCLDIIRRAGGAGGHPYSRGRSAGSAQFDVPAVSLLSVRLFRPYPADAATAGAGENPGCEASSDRPTALLRDADHNRAWPTAVENHEEIALAARPGFSRAVFTVGHGDAVDLEDDRVHPGALAMGRIIGHPVTTSPRYRGCQGGGRSRA